MEGRFNLFAAGAMLLSVVLFSAQPLVVVWAGGSGSPFLFNAGWRFGLVLGGALFLVTLYRPLLRDRRIVRLVMESVLPPLWRGQPVNSEPVLHESSIVRILARWAILLSVVGNLDFAVFAYSTRFVDISVTALLFEVWPLFMIFIVARMSYDNSRYRPITAETVALLAIGFLGVAFTTMSQLDGLDELLDLGGGAVNSLRGVGLALAAAFLTSLSGFSFRWSTDRSVETASFTGSQRQVQELEVFYIVVAFVICNAISALLNMLIGVIAGESIPIRSLLLGTFVGGTVIQAAGNVLWRLANLRTEDLGLNAISYATPCFSLGLLLAFSYVNVESGDYLAIGAIAIVTVNILVNFKAEERWGFKALVLALGATGGAVYLRERVFAYFGFVDWTWKGTTGYFEALALSATVFTLLLAFRVARLVSRAREENNRAFALFRNVQEMVGRGLLESRIPEQVRQIDYIKGRDLLRVYADVTRTLHESLENADAVDRERLSQIQAELDALVHSRQQGINFGELSSLFVFGGLTVILTLTSRPDFGPWGGFLVDLFDMLLASVVVFLTVNVLDLQSDRNSPVLEYRHEYAGVGVHFEDATDRTVERLVSVIAGLLVAITYALLMAHKWLGWFGGQS